MSYAKYLEDDIENAQERAWFRLQKYEPIPIRHTATEPIAIPRPFADKTIKEKTEPHQKYKPKNIVCTACKKVFLFSGGEQRYYKERKLSEPKRCRDCRQERKKILKAMKKQEERA